MAIERYLTKVNSVISNYILPLGLFFFLTGILFFKSISAYHTQIYLFLILPALILVLSKRDQFTPILTSRAFQILLVLIVYAMLSLFWNDLSIDDFKYIKRLLIIVLFILAVIAIGKESPDKIIKLLLIAAGIYGIAAYYSFFDDYLINNMAISERIVGLGNLSNPLLSSHIYGIFTAFLITYFFAIKRNWKKDLILILIFAGLLGFLILTHSRTPLVALSMVFLLLLWMHKSRAVLYFFLIICAIAAIYFSFNYDQLIQRGLSHRPEIWSIVMEKISHNPIFGTGLGSDIYIYIEDLKTTFTDSHNIHLGLTYLLGIVGLLLWLIFLVSLLTVYAKNKTTLIAQIGIVLLVYGMSAGMTEGGSFFSRPKEVWFLTWLPIALLLTAEFNRLTIKSPDKNSDRNH